jgi:hypothetical protein
MIKKFHQLNESVKNPIMSQIISDFCDDGDYTGELGSTSYSIGDRPGWSDNYVTTFPLFTEKYTTSNRRQSGTCRCGHHDFTNYSGI